MYSSNTVLMSIFTGWYIEKKNLKSGEIRQFLVKDIQEYKKRKRIRLLLDLDHEFKQPDADTIDNNLMIDFIERIITAKTHIVKDHFKPLFITPEIISNIEYSKELINACLEQSPINEVKLYQKNIDSQYIQGTTFIEGNTLNLQQVKDVLESGHFPSGKTLREVNEIQNYIDVLTYRRKYRGKITLSFIKKLHKLIVKNTREDEPGVFRKGDYIAISGCDYQVCPSILIEESLEKIIDEYYNNINSGFYPFESALYFHYLFEMIHPFNDGNGRVGRELLNYLLEREGYQQFLVNGEGRDKYLKSLKWGNEEDYKAMIVSFVEMYISFYSKIFESEIKNKKIDVKIKTD